MRLKRDTMSR